MPSIALNDLLECRVVCQLNDQIAINVYHYTVSAVSVVGGIPVTTAECAAHMSNFWDGTYISALPSVALFYGCGIRRLEPTLTIEDGNSAFQAAGGIVEQPLPAQMCGLFAITTGFGGRSMRGRKYVPFPCVTHVHTDTKTTAGYRAIIASIAAQYLVVPVVTGASGSTADLSPVLKHADNTWTAVTGYTVRTNWGTQRSRGGYGRPNPLPVW